MPGNLRHQIANFSPEDDNWLPLDELLSELWHDGPSSQDLPILFGVFERFPEDDGAGVLWSIIHGVESLPFDYEAELAASLARQESEMGRILWERLQRWKAKNSG